MPIFEYKCLDCNRVYEVFHKVREILEDVFCPACGSKNHKKLLSVPMAVGGRSPDVFSTPSTDSFSSDSCPGGVCGIN